MFDLMLTVAVVILVVMFVTLLLKLNPSSEKNKGSNEDFVQEPSESQSALRSESLPYQTVPDSMDALRSSLPKVRVVDSWQSREMGTSSAKPRADTPRIVVSADTSGASEVEEKPEASTSDYLQRRPEPSEPHVEPDSKPFTGQNSESDCLHKYGYLKGLPKNRPIPNECFGCSRIVECLAGKKQS